MRNVVGRVAVVAMFAVGMVGVGGCSWIGLGGEPAPPWVEGSDRGKFADQKYLVGKGSGHLTGDPATDLRNARDAARTDLLSQLIVTIQSEFQQRVSEYNLGDKSVSQNQAEQRVKSSVQGVLDVETEELEWRDTSGRRMHLMIAVDRAKYGASLRHRVNTIMDDQRVKLDAVEKRIGEGAMLHAMRSLASLEATVPDFLAAAASLAAVAGQGARPAPIAGPAKLAELHDRVRAGLRVAVKIEITPPAAGAPNVNKEAFESDVAAAIRTLRIATAEGGNATHTLSVRIRPNARMTTSPGAELTFALGEIDWHISLASNGPSDYSFAASSGDAGRTANRVTKNGTNLVQALQESQAKASAEIRKVLRTELSPD